jgi:ABC-2 type transport system permease protein
MSNLSQPLPPIQPAHPLPPAASVTASRSNFRDIYTTFFRKTLMEMSQYRANLAIWILSLIAEPIIYMTIWTTIAQQQGGSVDGITAGDFAAYYITWMLARHFAVTLSPEAMSWRVRTGAFSGLLMRPVHPIHADIGENIGYKLVALPIILLAMLGLAIAFPPTFSITWWSALAFIPAMILAFLIRFLSHWILGLAAFWTTRGTAIFEVFFVAEIFLTGRLAPMELLPEWVVILASVLPFRWMLSFPVELLLGRVAPQDLWIGFGAQIIWLVIMLLLLKVVWAAANRHYTAVGA